MAPSKKSTSSAAPAATAAASTADTSSAAASAGSSAAAVNTHNTPFLTSLFATQDISKMRRGEPQAFPAATCDLNRMVILTPTTVEMEGGKGSFNRAKVHYVYPNGELGPMIFTLGNRKCPKYCFGVNPDNVEFDGKPRMDDNDKPKPLGGYQTPIVLASKTGVTDQEQTEIDFLDALNTAIGNWACANKKLIGKGSKSDAAIEGQVKPIVFRKKDKDSGDFIEGATPMFYCKLKYFKKSGTCQTVYYGRGGVKID